MTPAELTKLEELARKATEYNKEEWNHILVCAANPQVILSLIDKLRRAEKLVEALEFYSKGGNKNMDRWQHPKLGSFIGKRAREAIAEWRAP